MWTISNSSVLKYIINVFLFYHSFKLTWSATDRRLVGDRSPTGRRPVATSRKEVPTRSPTSRRSVGNLFPISRRPVADQSPTSRRPTAKPSCDSSATSAIVLNFGRGEVAERLQCMSDLGFTYYNFCFARLSNFTHLYSCIGWEGSRFKCGIGVKDQSRPWFFKWNLVVNVGLLFVKTCGINTTEKGRDLTQSYDKSIYTSRNVKKAKWQHKQRHRKVRLHSGCGPT